MHDARFFDPREMALRGRIGGYAQKVKHDPRVTTEKARKAFLARFENEVDPNRELPEPERQRRSKAALSAHMARLAYLSAQSRRHRRDGNGGDRDE